MFDVWSLGIPVPEEEGEKLNKLILGIADKEASLGIDKKLTSKIQPKPEFHITLGVFHAGIFETTGSLFRHLFNYLKDNSAKVKELQDMFKGTITINGIGYDKHDIASSQVVWASVICPETHTIREKIHSLMRFAGVKDSHFRFTDPHITLFLKSGKGDLHEIPKPRKLPIHGFVPEHGINFGFEQVSLYKSSKIILTFGKYVWDGKPKDKFKTLLQAEVKARKPKATYNWGALFKAYPRDEALVIKGIIIAEGPGGLVAKGYKPGEIMKLIRVK